MESIYALAHAASVVFAYRVIIDLQSGQTDTSIIFPTMMSALVWLSGVSIFIFLKYPESLVDKTWIQVRGFINALMLMLALQGGMLM